MGTKRDTSCLIYDCNSCNKKSLFVFIGMAKGRKDTAILVCATCGEPEYFKTKESEDGGK